MPSHKKGNLLLSFQLLYSNLKNPNSLKKRKFMKTGLFIKTICDAPIFFQEFQTSANIYMQTRVEKLPNTLILLVFVEAIFLAYTM